MKLLIVCQALDKNHDNLGFFPRWVQEFAKHCDSVVVIASLVGTHDLPPNVAVHSLGKERNNTSPERALRLLYLSWKLRKEYDAVFVHMIPEFVLLCGLDWRAMGKKVGLWYVHGTVSWRLQLAEKLVHHIFTTSPESCRISSPKVHMVGHGIDVDFFTPDPSVTRGRHLLSVGRLSKSKRHDLAIRLAYEKNLPLRIAGSGPDRESLDSLARVLKVDVAFLGGISQEALRDEYRKTAALVHRSETGSIDKVVLEALACDTSIDATGLAYKNFPHKKGTLFDYVKDNHSLAKLVPNIIMFYTVK